MIKIDTMSEKPNHGFSFFTDKGYYNRKVARDREFKNKMLASGNRKLPSTAIYSTHPDLSQKYLRESLGK